MLFNVEIASKSKIARKRNIDNSPDFIQSANITYFYHRTLRPLIDKYGVCYQIASWFRCRELNKILKKSQNSVHTTGYAADLLPSINETAFNLAQKIKRCGSEYTKLILIKEKKGENYCEWIHLENNPDLESSKKEITIVRLDEEKVEYDFIYDAKVNK